MKTQRNVQSIEDKDQQRSEIRQHTIDYLNSGGKITECPPCEYAFVWTNKFNKSNSRKPK